MQLRYQGLAKPYSEEQLEKKLVYVGKADINPNIEKFVEKC